MTLLLHPIEVKGYLIFRKIFAYIVNVVLWCISTVNYTLKISMLQANQHIACCIKPTTSIYIYTFVYMLAFAYCIIYLGLTKSKTLSDMRWMDVTISRTVKVAKCKSGPFEHAESISKWLTGSVYIGNII